MNLLEHYIDEIISETEHITKAGTKYITVNLKCDCYGVREEVNVNFLPEEWEKAKTQGYYMA